MEVWLRRSGKTAYYKFTDIYFDSDSAKTISLPDDTVAFELRHSTWPGLVDDKNKPVTEVSSQTSGVFYAGTMNYGTFYIKETAAPSNAEYKDNAGKWFCVIIDGYGAHMSKEGYLGTGSTAAKKETSARADAFKSASSS